MSLMQRLNTMTINRALLVVGLLFIATFATAVRSTPTAVAQRSAPTVDYTIVIPPDHGPTLDVHMTVTAPSGALRTGIPGVSIELELPEGVAVDDITVASTGDAPVHLDALSPRVVHVYSDTSPSVTIAYSVRLQTGLQNPASHPAAPYASLHLGEFVYAAGRDTLAHPTIGYAAQVPTGVSVVLPPDSDWKAFAVNVGTIAPGQVVPVNNPKELVLLLGPLTVSHYDAPDTRLTFVTAGEMPWDAADAAASVQAMLASVRAHGLSHYVENTTFVQIRYPGALRLNPLITGHVVPDGTIIHWIGTGGLDRWRKHAARDLVGLLIDATVTVAPEATWFVAGLPEYAGLLLLHDAGYMTEDELYGALRTLYTTGVHYTGPGWPSLVLAGVSSPRSHAAQRVLEFRAPLVAFLLDAEIRTASHGTASLLDVWLDAADQQRRNPFMVFSTASLLPARAEFGDLSSFAEDFLFGSRIPPVDFDAVYRRWRGASQ